VYGLFSYTVCITPCLRMRITITAFARASKNHSYRRNSACRQSVVTPFKVIQDHWF